MTDLPTEPGWYVLAEEAPDGFWNPYLLHDDGTWIEAQSEGHIEVTPDQIEVPLVRAMTMIPRTRAHHRDAAEDLLDQVGALSASLKEAGFLTPAEYQGLMESMQVALGRAQVHVALAKLYREES